MTREDIASNILYGLPVHIKLWEIFGKSLRCSGARMGNGSINELFTKLLPVKHFSNFKYTPIPQNQIFSPNGEKQENRITH